MFWPVESARWLTSGIDGRWWTMRSVPLLGGSIVEGRVEPMDIAAF